MGRVENPLAVLNVNPYFTFIRSHKHLKSNKPWRLGSSGEPPLSDRVHQFTRTCTRGHTCPLVTLHLFTLFLRALAKQAPTELNCVPDEYARKRRRRTYAGCLLHHHRRTGCACLGVEHTV